MIVRAAFALVLLQIAGASADAPIPNPQFFRYQRAISLPDNTNGQACVVLDAQVFAHAAHQSLDDVRLYSNDTREVPFILTESGATRVGDEQAEVRNAGIRSGDVVFDLHMPNRPYTAVELDLNEKDFLATAEVTGANGSEAPVRLGGFALFDLTSQHLSRSTTLPLQESTFSTLHVALHIVPSPGSPSRTFAATIVRGATVPPSREAQTLYTPVANVSSFTSRGRASVASVHIPAHVPVERISFELDPSFTQSFLRTVNITARPDNTQDTSAVEAVSGEISHTTLPASSTGFVTEQSLSHHEIDAVLGADLRDGATVDIAVQNGDDPPLPVRGVTLQMRQRRVCFDASATMAPYSLRYDDDSLKAPIYEYARLFTGARAPAVATLGGEEKNPSFHARHDARPYSERHPELLWLALVAAVAGLGTIAMRSARKRH